MEAGTVCENSRPASHVFGLEVQTHFILMYHKHVVLGGKILMLEYAPMVTLTREIGVK
jgi:hypothetical protein